MFKGDREYRSSPTEVHRCVCFHESSSRFSSTTTCLLNLSHPSWNHCWFVLEMVDQYQKVSNICGHFLSAVDYDHHGRVFAQRAHARENQFLLSVCSDLTDPSHLHASWHSYVHMVVHLFRYQRFFGVWFIFRFFEIKHLYHPLKCFFLREKMVRSVSRCQTCLAHARLDLDNLYEFGRCSEMNVTELRVRLERLKITLHVCSGWFWQCQWNLVKTGSSLQDKIAVLISNSLLCVCIHPFSDCQRAKPLASSLFQPQILRLLWRFWHCRRHLFPLHHVCHRGDCLFHLHGVLVESQRSRVSAQYVSQVQLDGDRKSVV